MKLGLRIYLSWTFFTQQTSGFTSHNRFPLHISSLNINNRIGLISKERSYYHHDLHRDYHSSNTHRMTSSATIPLNDEFPSNQTMLSTQSPSSSLIDIPMSDDTSSSSFPSSTTTKTTPFLLTLWRFTRPHTLIGSAIAIPSLHLLAAPTLSSAFTLPMLLSLIVSLIPSLLMNVYITGLNQITDVEIDKINKPNLPIAKGDLSPRNAIIIVTTCLVASLLTGCCTGAFTSEGLTVALVGSAILGTMYSLPPFRLKRFPLLAAFCIVAVRGVVINAGFYAHAMAVGLGRGGGGAGVMSCLASEVKCLWSSLFFGIFGIVIALMKDVPDVKGDAIMNIRSLSVRIGPKVVHTMMRSLLSLLFVSTGAAFLKGALLGAYNSSWGLRCCRYLVAGFGFWMGWTAWAKGKGVNAEDSGEVYSYYMELWKLFYLSYLALPFAR